MTGLETEATGVATMDLARGMVSLSTRSERQKDGQKKEDGGVVGAGGQPTSAVVPANREKRQQRRSAKAEV